MATRRPVSPWQREKPELIADELRARILGREFDDGQVLGREPELVTRFGVSRPCLREALRILETEGLVTVVRGSRGGVTVHVPDQSVTARMAAMFLQAQGVPLADVHAARAEIEPAAACKLAKAADRQAALAVLGNLVAAQEGLVDDPAAFGPANASFHHTLVALAGNRTLAIVTEVLDEVIDRTVDIAALALAQPMELRRHAIRSQRELLQYLEAGDADGAERHWQRHLDAAGSVVLGTRSADLVDGTSMAR
jgi:GntR family transcriptional regulator, transcriptional repressor for pyruvate dehydrogenase complex